MKKFEHAIIIIGGCLFAFGLIFAMIYHEAEQKRIEKERRNEMFILHNYGDDCN